VTKIHNWQAKHGHTHTHSNTRTCIYLTNSGTH